MKESRTLAYVAFGIVCLVWGTTYLAIRVALESMTPLLLTGFRFTTAGTIMLIIAFARGERFPRLRSELLNLVLIGVLMVGVGNLAVVWAEQWVPSGMAALLIATAPFWMAIIEAFRKEGERTGLRGTLGMLIGFGGVALLMVPHNGGSKLAPGFLLGALAIQLGSLCWQLGSVRGKYYLKNVPLLMSAALQMLFGGIIVTIVGFALGEWSHFAVTPRALAGFLYLIVFGSIIAYSSFVYALAHMSTTKSSLYAYVNPVVAVILGWLILNEELTWISITAMCVILAGVALVQTSRARRTPAVSVTSECEQRSAA